MLVWPSTELVCTGRAYVPTFSSRPSQSDSNAESKNDTRNISKADIEDKQAHSTKLNRIHPAILRENFPISTLANVNIHLH